MAEPRQPGNSKRLDPGAYDVAPPYMPPAPAGAEADIGGEAAASRRVARLPPDLVDTPVPPGEVEAAEPILGYDGLEVDGVLEWIRDADPDADQLRAMLQYEAGHRDRLEVMRECAARLRRLEQK